MYGNRIGGRDMDLLIVDRNKEMRSIIKRLLRRAGYKDKSFREAGSESEALEMIEEDAPDLILADWTSPGMAGTEDLELLRSPSVPFGVITSEMTDEMHHLSTCARNLFLFTWAFSIESFQRAVEPRVAPVPQEDLEPVLL